MSAPALVLLAHAGSDPRVGGVVAALRDLVAAQRPALVVASAPLDSTAATIATVRRLAHAGSSDIAFVPLELTHAIEAHPAVDQLVASCRAAVDDVALTASRPVGPEISLLTVLDERLRAALSQARVLELDGLVLCAESAGDVRGAALLARRARQWSTHHRLPCLIAAADGTGPSVAQAIQGLRAQGRRHIAVGSFFLTADEPYLAQADLALRCGAVAVSEPLGASREVAEAVLARYAFGAMDLLDQAHNVGTFDDLFGDLELSA